jgi:hypothetical protein
LSWRGFAGPGLRALAFGFFGQLMQCKHHAFAQPERGLDGIAEADADFFIHHQPVHHGLDVVEFLLVELDTGDVFAKFGNLGIHANPHKTFPGEALKYVAKFAFLPAHHGRQQHHAGLGRQREDFVHDVAGTLGGNRHAGFRTM